MTAMGKVVLNLFAPDFSLVNIDGKLITLSEFQNARNVLLVFNRGFA